MLTRVQRRLRAERPRDEAGFSGARWVRAHPSVVDALTATALFAFSVPQLLFHARMDDPLLGAYVLLTALLVAPLVFRRRWPMRVFVIIAAVGAVQWLLGVQLAADVEILIALATVAASYPFRRAVLAATIAEVGAVAAAWRWPHGLHITEMLTVLSGFVVAATMSGAYIYNRRQLIGLLERDRTRLQRERDHAAEVAAADERIRIGRDMHDAVGHALTVIITLAAASTGRAARDPERVEQAVKLIEQSARTALSDTRSAVRGWRADASLQPPPALRDVPDLIDEARGAGLQAALNMRGQLTEVPTSVGVCAYRVVQEALTNTLKHASPSCVTVTLAVSTDSVLVQVDNDGTANTAVPAGHGVGLAGMRERVASVGGTLSAGPTAGHGWRVKATLPIASPPSRTSA